MSGPKNPIEQIGDDAIETGKQIIDSVFSPSSPKEDENEEEEDE